MNTIIYCIVSSDFTLHTENIRLNPLDPSPTQEVLITFRVDGIAQEGEETLQLRLTPRSSLPSALRGANAFFIDTIPLTIMDSDGKYCLSSLHYSL